jgi:hypothetical protein
LVIIIPRIKNRANNILKKMATTIHKGRSTSSSDILMTIEGHLSMGIFPVIF